MGADLIVSSIPGFMPNPERRNKIVALIAACTNIPEEVRTIVGDESDYRVQTGWEYAVLEVFDALTESRQISSVATYAGDNSWVYVTGGDSWGDNPSDYFNGFILMQYGGILEEMKKWATEDRTTPGR